MFYMYGPANPQTPAMKNVEARYSIGGGSPNYLPAGGTQRGDKDQNVPRSFTVEGGGAKKAPGASKEKERLSSVESS